MTTGSRPLNICPPKGPLQTLWLSSFLRTNPPWTGLGNADVWLQRMSDFPKVGSKKPPLNNKEAVDCKEPLQKIENIDFT